MDVSSTFLHDSNLILANGKINTNAKKIITANDDIKRKIEQQTQFIDAPILESLKERIYCILNEIVEAPKCSCGEKLPFVQRKYQLFCSRKCANGDTNRKEQIKKTNMLRYGGHPMRNEDIKTKGRNTCLEKYGAEYHQQSPVGKQTRINTNIKKFNSTSPFGADSVQKKSATTNIERYGNSSFAQSKISPESLIKLNDKDWLIETHIKQQLPIYKIADFLQVSTFCVKSYMEKAGIECQRFFSSVQQEEILSFIKSQIPDEKIVTNVRDIIHPHELDIFIPSKNLAFEINGIYWHSELSGKDRKYHINKTNKCNEKEIRLIQITDIEWLKKRDIVQSRISCLINTSKIIYARKCKIIELTKDQSKEFFNINHIQGHVGEKMTYGLSLNGEIVCAMSFGIPRFAKQYQWELLRFSNKLKHSIVGGASRLFSHFLELNDPTTIISYSDKRWNTGQVYSKLKFNHQYVSAPSYHIFYRNNPHIKLYHRSSFQKHKLEKKLEVFDPLLSEWENLKINGYDRIWDCGNDVWLWNK